MVAGIILARPLLALAAMGIDGPWLGMLAITAAIPAIDLAVAIVTNSSRAPSARHHCRHSNSQQACRRT